jgi:hypothetical protein
MATPIYLAIPRGKMNEIPAFRERGIPDKAPGEIDDIDIQVQSGMILTFISFVMIS